MRKTTNNQSVLRKLFERILQHGLFTQMFILTIVFTLCISTGILLHSGKIIDLNIIKLLGLLWGAAVVFLFLIRIVIIHAVIRPLKALEPVSERIKEGDLSRKFEIQGCKEAIHGLEHLNQAIDGLRTFISGINGQADVVYSASDVLKQTAVNNSEASSQVIVSMEELAKGTTEQSENLSEVAEGMRELTKLIIKVNQDTKDIACSSAELSDSAVEGQKISNEVTQQIENIYDSTRNIESVVSKLNNVINEVGTITSEIKDIAVQTNLLALNASIEAARAGEQGRGFAVVANETGKLANRSVKATSMINDLLKEMVKSNSAIMEAIESGIGQVERGRELTGNSRVKFEQIFEGLKGNTSKLNDFADFIERINQNTKRVNETINNIAAFSEEIMARTEEVLGVSHQQTENAEKVTGLAQQLTHTSEVLKQSIKIYLTFSFFGNKEGRIEQTRAAFDKYMGKNGYINLKFGEVAKDSKAYYPAMMQQLQRGIGPDLLQINQPWLVEMKEKGNFILNLYENDTLDLSGFDKNILNMCTEDEYLMGLPTGLNALCFFVNKNFFRKYNIPEDTVWNWNNFLETGSRIHASNSNDYLFYCLPEYMMHLIKMYIRQRTGLPFIKDNYQIGFSASDLTDAFTYLKKLVENGVIYNNVQFNDQGEFVNNERTISYSRNIGMTGAWVSDYHKIEKARFVNCGASITLPPVSEDAKISAIMMKPQLILSVNRISQNQKEVMKFLNWIFYSPEGIKAWGTSRGPSPTENGLRIQQEQKMVDPIISNGIKMAMDMGGQSENAISSHSEITGLFLDMTNKLFSGEIAPEQASYNLYHMLEKRLYRIQKRADKKSIFKHMFG